MNTRRKRTNATRACTTRTSSARRTTTSRSTTTRWRKAIIPPRKQPCKRRNATCRTTVITSPIDGVVISRAVEEGQTVASGFETPTLFTIAADLTQMQVVADVDEADIGGVQEGQRVTFTVDALSPTTCSRDVSRRYAWATRAARQPALLPAPSSPTKWSSAPPTPT